MSASLPLNAPLAREIADGRRRKPVVLCVDDEQTVLETLRHSLQEALDPIFQVELAETGEEGLELMDALAKRNQPVAAIVADQLMPGMKGDAFLIEAHKRSPSTINIMLTGQAHADQVGNALNQAALYRYIAKPWDDTDLRRTVEEAALKFLNAWTIEEQNRRLKHLHTATSALGRLTDEIDFLKALAAALVELTGQARVWLALNTPDGPRWRLTPGPDGAPLWQDEPLAEAPNRPTALAKAVLAGQPIPADQASTALAHPLCHGNEVLAAVLLQTEDGQAPVLDDQRQELLDILLGHGAVGLENALLLADVERQVNDRARAALAAASQKDEAVRIVAHDIRGPLSGISNLAELLQDEDGADHATVKEYADIIRNAIRTVLRLVNDVLDLAKLESGTIVLNRTEVDLKALLERTAQTYTATARPKNLTLTVEAKPMPGMMVDETRLYQAIGNLVGNAIKFTEAGKAVTLRLHEAEAKGRNWAVIEVADQGVGIPPDELPRVFERFGKYQRQGTRGEKGSGLGLSLAKEVVELHDGHMEVESTPGQGTTFRIWLPEA